MAGDLTRKYLWMIDLLLHRGPCTRVEISNAWLDATCTDGNPIPERTFFHLRRAIEQNLGIEIKCNNYNEYYIEKPANRRDATYRNWLLDYHAITNTLNNNPDAYKYILVEAVPSSREWLNKVISAIRDKRKIVFAYRGYSRSLTEKSIVFWPYLVKLYKQRWYMLGFQEKKGEMRTYALDRIKEMHVLKENFEMPENEDPAQIFSEIVGVTSSKGTVHTVRIMASTTQSKYLRALPLHESQQEVAICDKYSIFEYKLKLNYELVHELLGFGSQVEVLEPKELKVMIAEELKRMAKAYDIRLPKKSANTEQKTENEC